MVSDLPLGSAKPLDAVFAAGPSGFLAGGLATYLALLGGEGEGASAPDFADRYGVALPAEAALLFEAMAGHDPEGAFAELRLDPGADEELAFCGVFALGTQDNGDVYYMEIYSWDEALPRQILLFDRAAGAFSVVADSLESLVFLAALTCAHDRDALSAEGFASGLRALRGRIAPTWQFAVEDRDPGFVRLEPARRDTEFFYFRAAWIAALLHDADLDEVRTLFRSDFNQATPIDQLPARLEACEAFIPTALYAMWRAYLFHEAELGRYLEMGHRHASRIVREAALRIARGEFPRPALQGLEPDPWRDLHDGAAHRTLLETLDRGLIASVDALRGFDERGRASAIEGLAVAMPGELEAILVGSIVRDDRLAGVLRVPRGPADRPAARALGISRRAFRLAPDDTDVQFTHAMMMLDAGELAELFVLLPSLPAPVRANVAVRMAGGARFADAVDVALAGGQGEQIGEEALEELGESILLHAPERLPGLLPRLPDDIDLLGVLAYKAIRAAQHDHAIALYDRLLALPIPDAGHERGTYLRALNNACVQAHAAQAYDAAVRIANRAQPVAHENPYIYHAAACAYAAVGDYAKAFEQVKLAVEHEYDHIVKVETDQDLGPLLEWPEFQALFRDWRARLEGN